MPLIDIRQLSPGVRLGLWAITEPADTPRLRERQAVASLLTAMTGDDSLTIGHEESGKPFVCRAPRETPFVCPSSGQAPLPCAISVSHTRGYAVLMLSDRVAVGVDIEYRSDRVERIAARFIRPDEEAVTTDDKLLVWSAKEAVYKLFSEERLALFDMRTLSIDPGLLRMENLKRKIVVDVHYEFADDYVLTYVLMPGA